MKKTIFLLFVLAVCLFPVQGLAESFVGKCVGVTDGDTISVMHNGKAEKIRLNGIDCPESHQDFGIKAKKFASYLVSGENVRIEVIDTDKYGRTVGNVYASDGQSLNKALVEQGLAWWYRKYAPDDKELEQLEIKARKAEKGLWSRPDAIAPWDFRHGGGAKVSVQSSLGAKTEELLKEFRQRYSGYDNLDDHAVIIRLIEQYIKSSAQAQTTVQKKSSARNNKEVTVYITKTGRKYHRGNCRYLSKSKIPIALSEAKRRYGPCSKCNPPR